MLKTDEDCKKRTKKSIIIREIVKSFRVRIDSHPQADGEILRVQRACEKELRRPSQTVGVNLFA
jgi:hypothetical protein